MAKREVPEIVNAAIDTIARQATVNAARELKRDRNPKISESDWQAVVARANQILMSMVPSTAEFKAAYEVLESRAAPTPPPPPYRGAIGKWIFRGFDQLNLPTWSWTPGAEHEEVSRG